MKLYLGLLENQADQHYIFIRIPLIFSLLNCKTKTEERFLLLINVSTAVSMKARSRIHFDS